MKTKRTFNELGNWAIGYQGVIQNINEVFTLIQVERKAKLQEEFGGYVCNAYWEEPEDPDFWDVDEMFAYLTREEHWDVDDSFVWEGGEY